MQMVVYLSLLCFICYSKDIAFIWMELPRWIQNWLEDRQQTVVLDGVSSEAVSIDSGVPQGSVHRNSLFEIHVVVDMKCCFFLHVA
jgi:hypothetical protein